MAITCTLNGQPASFDVDPETPLLWVLRDTAGLTGTKFGCGAGACGACTVHVDGAAVDLLRSRSGAVADASIITIEGLEGTDGRTRFSRRGSMCRSRSAGTADPG